MNRPSSTSMLRHHRLAAAVLAALLPVGAMAAPALEFNADFLHGAGAGLDLSRFQNDGPLPGTYSADIVVNDVLVGRHDVEARAGEDGEVTLCLDPALFALMSLDETKLDAYRQKDEGRDLLPLPEQATCEAISRFIPSASVYLDSGEQQLQVSIPQAYLRSNRSGWVAPDRWDTGINAALINYSVNHNRFESGGRQSSHTGATIDAGLNLGAWRFRHSGYFSQDSNGNRNYSASRSFAEREIRALNAQLTVGESSTAGDLFDSVSYTGINLRTDPRMLPEVFGSYAPMVRGLAQTNARVTIRQAGRVVFETTVAPGPFEIDDLRNTAGSGDLEVEVTEADGRVETFVVPFASVPQLLRQGQQRTSLTVGQLRNDAIDAPAFVEATLRRGVGSGFTAFGGATVADGYNAIILGGALNTRLGAFSGDVTFSDTRLPSPMEGFGKRMQGQSYRLAYSRSFNTATSFTLAAYRYSTEGYLSFSDAARLRHDLANGNSGSSVTRQRSRIDLTVNQRLPKGSLYLNGSTTDYWSENRRTTNFSLGYNGQLGRASYSISARRTLESSLFNRGSQKQSTGAYLSVSVPLGRAPAAPRLSASASSDRNGGSYRAGVNGSFGDGMQGSYNLSYGQAPGSTNIGANVAYAAPVANLNASWSRSDTSQQLGLSASGGVVLHGDGVTFSQRLGDTVGLVHVPDGPGAGVGSYRGVKTNKRGYAVVPYLSAYRMNEIAVDPTGLPMDVELKSGSVTAVPTAGAVVKAVIPTASGRTALIEALDNQGQPLPFGLDVYDEAGQVVGVVGQGSRLWVRGINDKGQLRVNPGANPAQSCTISYDLGAAASDQLYISSCLRANVAERNEHSESEMAPGAPN
ncbi:MULTISPECIES: fimbria/pilus outer membrane usher protein [Stenotrophomonas]|uniref:fimbria/pilus outer membrane usher protein n=1 Tax=Stenotrophomonas TaxID=40323 RepID=UPI00066B6343|nr:MULTISPECIES: fimbria/pilus outer membrane usher protein [Stenotrophomonas]MBA0351438.1 fimbrial biogenesis outer membrane usher protein [Stenotrophomonas maltophilia]MBH1693351.1 fimbrial biogenesis outer membrane usher protein [Stenotrophomonas maltophilia]MBH1818220.1 fimbrial biogenesis outer membrane usher protein [Stenotrophomonas maltophilia]MCU1029535.1 fimbrial biogenesis outer membrane usher protein [Stenotrophomonas maltophilia]MDH0549664.1 fimbrial biogenesis outer membrane ushe